MKMSMIRQFRAFIKTVTNEEVGLFIEGENEIWRFGVPATEARFWGQRIGDPVMVQVHFPEPQ